MAPSVVRASRRIESRRAGARGFTLTELLAVIAITGILAGLAIASLRQRAFASDVTSAKVIIRTIAAAEEQYRAENQVYLDVSSPGESWYPRGTNTLTRNTKVAFWRTQPGNTNDTETNAWRRLAPDIRNNQTVTFGFKANAGLPDKAPVFDDELAGGKQPTIVEPWYLIQARADADSDGVGCMVGAASWTPELFLVNEGE
jgi:prepilin-type N-terminal cleavage/methylation domain-containing protein